jgi:hypothetical protein
VSLGTLGMLPMQEPGRFTAINAVSHVFTPKRCNRTLHYYSPQIARVLIAGELLK